MSMIKIQHMKHSKDKLNTLFLKTQGTFNFISLLLKYLFFSLSPFFRDASHGQIPRNSNKRKCRVSRLGKSINKDQEETVEQKSKKQRKAIEYIRSSRFEKQC